MLSKTQLNTLRQAANRAGWRLQLASAVKEKALKTAIDSFAPEARQEEVYAFFNTAVFGNKAGFLLTSEGLYSDRFSFMDQYSSGENRIPFEGIISVEPSSIKESFYDISYKDGGSIVVYSSSVYRDGLLALLNAAIRIEQTAAANAAGQVGETSGAAEPEGSKSLNSEPVNAEVNAELQPEPDPVFGEGSPETICEQESAKAESSETACEQALVKEESAETASGQDMTGIESEEEIQPDSAQQLTSLSGSDSDVKNSGVTEQTRCIFGSYLYEADGTYNFMENETYEMYEAKADVIGGALDPEKDINCQVTLYIRGDQVVRIEKTARQTPNSADDTDSEAVKMKIFIRTSKEYVQMMKEVADGAYENAVRLAEEYDQRMGGHIAQQALKQLAKLAAAFSYDSGLDAVKREEYEEAVKLFQKAADMGDGDAMFALGLLYQSEEWSGGRNPQKAEEWFEKAAEAGNENARLELRKRKAPELLAKLNNKPEYDYRDKDALQLEALKCGRDCYFKKDYENAAILLSVAVDAGYYDACYLMGRMYAEGLGVEQSGKKAKTLFEALQPGKIGHRYAISLGMYPQENGSRPEPIRWIVIDRKDDRLLLLSEKLLDQVDYYREHVAATWEKSDLREWLNNYFMGKAFTRMEREILIQKSRLENPDNEDENTKGGPPTEDKVFLLSVREMQKYFISGVPRALKERVSGSIYYETDDNMAAARSTSYAKTHKDVGKYPDLYSWWSLRTPGIDCNVVIVDEKGMIQAGGCWVDEVHAVRPALWLNLDPNPPVMSPVSAPQKSDLEQGRQYFYAGAYSWAYSSLVCASLKGSAEADFMLGRMYAAGLGITKDIKMAKMYFDKLQPKPIGERDIISFGQYPQDHFGNKEPVEWIILDRQGDQLLLLSRKILNVQSNVSMEQKWKKSGLRNWLNEEFLNNTFSQTERDSMIQKTRLETPRNPDYRVDGGPDTEDKVFLLSIQEAEKYFISGTPMRMKEDESLRKVSQYYYETDEPCAAGKATLFVKRKAGFWYTKRNFHWWLRSPGVKYNKYCKNVACVTADGNINVCGKDICDSDKCGIRPAMWVSLKL